MTTPAFRRFALALAAAAFLAGCGGSQPPIGATGAVPQSHTVAHQAERGGSWMLPDAKTHDLVYSANFGSGTVTVYSYPQGKLYGTLAEFHGPGGLCVDQQGDVFVTNSGVSRILEYAHGGIQPIAVLHDGHEYPDDCDVNPNTKDLAVVNVGAGPSDPGNVVTYRYLGRRWGLPRKYFDAGVYWLYFCGYDPKGNLFVDGATESGNEGFQLAELPGQRHAFESISVNQSIQHGGGVRWAGNYLVIGDELAQVIYQFAVSGSTATEVGSTPLNSSSAILQFWIQGKNVVVPDDTGTGDLAIYRYPSGGSQIKTLAQNLDYPNGTVVSLAR